MPGFLKHRERVAALCMYGGGDRKLAKKGAGKVSGKRDGPVYMEIKTTHRPSSVRIFNLIKTRNITDRVYLSALILGPDGTSLIRNSAPLGPCSTGVPRS